MIMLRFNADSSPGQSGLWALVKLSALAGSVARWPQLRRENYNLPRPVSGHRARCSRPFVVDEPRH